MVIVNQLICLRHGLDSKLFVAWWTRRWLTATAGLPCELAARALLRSCGDSIGLVPRTVLDFGPSERPKGGQASLHSRSSTEGPFVFASPACVSYAPYDRPENRHAPAGLRAASRYERRSVIAAAGTSLLRSLYRFFDRWFSVLR